MKWSLALFVLLVPLASRAEDMRAYLNETRKLVREGKYEEALERVIWFHEHALEYEPAMAGVRLSFALNSWKNLGEKYPPAQTALVEMRDQTLIDVIQGEGSFAEFHDLVALNRVLGEAEITVEHFVLCAEKHPDQAQSYWIAAKDAVMAAKRYDLARKYMGDVKKEFARLKARYDYDVTLYGDPRIDGARFQAYTENAFVEETLDLIEVALATDQPDAARTVQQKALATLDDPRLRDALPSPKAGQSEE